MFYRLLPWFPPPSFDFCAVEAEKRPSENLGQVLFGERIEPSPYKVPPSGGGQEGAL